MRRRTGTLAAICCAVLVAAAPGTALAQSAGDDQYADPFGEVNKEKSGSGSPNTGSGSGSGQAAGTPGPGTQPAGEQQGTQTQTSASPGLPRSGLPAGLLAGAGSALLAAGTLLRRRT